MITTYLRSSSIGAWNICPFSFYLNYVLGIPSKTNKAAAKGNVTHKSLELLALQSMHRARGNSTFEDETFGSLRTEDITPELATEKSYWYYRELEPEIRWNDKYDLRDCHEWTQNAITRWGGRFDPRKMIIIEPEKRFDLLIDRLWARYEFDTPEGKLEGQLSIKGTMDLVVADEHDPDEIQVVDWKTGFRRDWGIEDEIESIKDWRKLMKDPQLWLYYYACRRLYPTKTTHMTIVFINDKTLKDGTLIKGGPFRLCFDDETLAQAENMLKEKFEAIRGTQHPEARKSKVCYSFCSYGTRSQAAEDPSKTICDYHRERVRREGADAVFYQIGNVKSLTSYGTGGGRQATAE